MVPNQLFPCGTKVSVKFKGYKELFDGVVASFDDEVSHHFIKCEDGDHEEPEEDELIEALLADPNDVNQHPPVVHPDSIGDQEGTPDEQPINWRFLTSSSFLASFDWLLPCM